MGTAILAFFSSFLDMLEKLGPEIIAWIKEVCEPGEEQSAMDARMRRCKRKCRRGKFNLACITAQVNEDFADLASDKVRLADIVLLISNELKVTK